MVFVFKAGPIAQRLEQQTHNLLVPGSNPGGPTIPKSSMTATDQNSPAHGRIAALLGAVIFISFIYFYEGGGWNQNSRFDLLRAMVERHTLTIDAYHQNTQDKAHFRGHYYSDNAPGLVFTAVPLPLATRSMMGIAGVDVNSARG